MTTENIAFVQITGFSKAKNAQISKSNHVASTVAALKRKKTKCEVVKKRNKKQDVWEFNLLDGFKQSFSKLSVNGALGTLPQKATFDCFSSAAHKRINLFTI